MRVGPATKILKWMVPSDTRILLKLNDSEIGNLPKITNLTLEEGFLSQRFCRCKIPQMLQNAPCASQHIPSANFSSASNRLI